MPAQKFLLFYQIKYDIVVLPSTSCPRAMTIASLLKGGYGFSQHVQDGYKGACVT